MGWSNIGTPECRFLPLNMVLKEISRPLQETLCSEPHYTILCFGVLCIFLDDFLVHLGGVFLKGLVKLGVIRNI